MKRLRRGLVTGLTLAAIAAFDSARALAHHSFAMYDQSIKYVFTAVDRLWARIWEEYFEKGMKRPADADGIGGFK